MFLPLESLATFVDGPGIIAQNPKQSTLRTGVPLGNSLSIIDNHPTVMIIDNDNHRHDQYSNFLRGQSPGA